MSADVDPRADRGPSDRGRVEDLVASGRLSAAEAAPLLDALAELERRAERVASPVPRCTPGQAARTKLAVLRGELGAEELLRGQRRVAVAMGLFFGLFTGAIHGFVLEWAVLGHSVWMGTLFFLTHLLLGGPLFGWAMYRFLLRPSAERLSALVEASGPLLEPRGPVPAGRCPTCSAERFETWGPRHLGLLHWRWNPGLAFNELVLGQRIPERLCVCEECGSNWVDCPACDQAIDGTLWTARDVFCRWGGLACPHCRASIPTVRNVWAGLLLLPLRLFRRGEPVPRPGA